jgi:hypothetical protein
MRQTYLPVYLNLVGELRYLHSDLRFHVRKMKMVVGVESRHRRNPGIRTMTSGNVMGRIPLTMRPDLQAD